MNARDKAVGILGARKLRELEGAGLAVVEKKRIDHLLEIEKKLLKEGEQDG